LDEAHSSIHPAGDKSAVNDWVENAAMASSRLSKLLRVLFFISSLVLLASVASAEQETSIVDPDDGLTVMQMVERRGYAVEEHKVTTADRFVLTMYRLPKTYAESQANATAAANKPAVYLIHGLLDSSFTYVLNFRNQSLAYLLADAGYDVWLGNNRGTTWSNEHLDYTTDDDEYWDFSWQEMASYDMPAMINYVLDVSGRPMLSYVGHSEGTMQAFAGFSTNQELAQRVSYFGALAPVAYLGHIESPIFLALADTYLDKLSQLLGVDAFFQTSELLQGLIGKYACAFVDVACNSIINALTGPSDNVNTTRIQVYISQTPAGTSVKNMAHFAQGIRDNTFRRYDYGCSCLRVLGISLCSSLICKNKAIYGSFDPPDFDLSTLKYPRTAFFTGSDDWLATSTDISQMRDDLPSGTVFYDTTVAYNHLDFTWGYNAHELIYGQLLEHIAEYNEVEY
jgi:pimeloyl-ACP methyl ester carboxylesterase